MKSTSRGAILAVLLSVVVAISLFLWLRPPPPSRALMDALRACTQGAVDSMSVLPLGTVAVLGDIYDFKTDGSFGFVDGVPGGFSELEKRGLVRQGPPATCEGAFSGAVSVDLKSSAGALARLFPTLKGHTEQVLETTFSMDAWTIDALVPARFESQLGSFDDVYRNHLDGDAQVMVRTLRVERPVFEVTVRGDAKVGQDLGIDPHLGTVKTSGSGSRSIVYRVEFRESVFLAAEFRPILLGGPAGAEGVWGGALILETGVPFSGRRVVSQ